MQGFLLQREMYNALITCRSKLALSQIITTIVMQGRIIHEAGEAEASGPGPPDRPVQKKIL